MSVEQINVGIVSDDEVDEVEEVGKLLVHDAQIYFEYDYFFVDCGLEISPLACPLSLDIRTYSKSVFESLPGVFNDSLPDGWGRLLFDR